MYNTDILETQEILCSSFDLLTEGRSATSFRQRGYNRFVSIANESRQKAMVDWSVQTSPFLLNLRGVSTGTACIDFGNTGLLPWDAKEETLKTLSNAYDVYLKIAYLRLNSQFTEEIENIFLNNALMADIVSEVLIKLKENVSSDYPDSKNFVQIELIQDKEDSMTEQLVMSLFIRVDNFENIVSIWNKAGKIVESIISKFKYVKEEEMKEIERIDSMLAIEIKRL